MHGCLRPPRRELVPAPCSPPAARQRQAPGHPSLHRPALGPGLSLCLHRTCTEAHTSQGALQPLHLSCLSPRCPPPFTFPAPPSLPTALHCHCPVASYTWALMFVLLRSDVGTPPAWPAMHPQAAGSGCANGPTPRRRDELWDPSRESLQLHPQEAALSSGSPSTRAPREPPAAQGPPKARKLGL